jgi:hypothetical protein
MVNSENKRVAYIRKSDLKGRTLWRPQAGGQMQAFGSDAFELLGGGSAGGGKSWFLVVDALGIQYTERLNGRAAFQNPGYRAVLFRRESTQLDKLITEAKRLYPAFGGVYCGGRQGEPGPSFEFPQYDSKVFFCHLQTESDKENHQGQEYQYVGFDELTHFTVTQYLYLFSRLRSTIANLPVRVRSTCNPTGEGLWWVRKRFIDNWKPGVLKYFTRAENPEDDPRGKEVAKGTKGAMSRVFIPFWLQDNKILYDNDPQYVDRIAALGAQMEKALLGGDWYAFGGDFFPSWDRHKELIDPFFIPKNWQLIGSVDPGFSSPCSFGLHASDPKGNYYRIFTYYESKRSPEVHAKAIKKMIEDCKWTYGRMPSRIVAGHDAFSHADRYSVIETEKTFADVFTDNGLFLEKAAIERLNGWWNWKSLMPKRWFVFKDMNDPLLQEMASAVSDEKRPEDLKGRGLDPTVKDHALDETRYGLMAIAVSTEEHPEDKGWEFVLLQNKSQNKGYLPGRG